jgi:conjugal transfer pilus assembly protein TraV
MTPHRSTASSLAGYVGLAVLAGLLAALLSGCSGLGGSSKLTCSLPEGSRCDSVSNTYTDAFQGELPGQRGRNGNNKSNAHANKDEATAAPASSMEATYQRLGSGSAEIARIAPAAVTTGMPLRSAPKVVRVWIKPWEDADGDLHDQSFIYLTVSEGRWALEEKQREVRQAFLPSPARAAVPAAPLPPAAAASAATAGASTAVNAQTDGARRGG